MSLPLHIKNQVNLSPSEEKDIGKLFHRKELTKGTMLFQQGEFCKHVWFIETGMARYYYVSDSGREITSWFFTDNQFLTSMDSFYVHQPTEKNCVLLEDSVIYSLDESELEEILEKSHAMSVFLFRAMYWAIKKHTEFLFTIRFRTAQERYEILLSRYPHIFQRAQLNHIASYLDISPETLSRLRAQK